MLIGCNLKKGPFFIFDKTPFKKKPPGFDVSNIHQNHTPNMFSQTTNFSMSQSSFDFTNSYMGNSFSQNPPFNPMMNNINFDNNTTYSYLSQQSDNDVEVNQGKVWKETNNSYNYATM